MTTSRSGSGEDTFDLIDDAVAALDLRCSLCSGNGIGGRSPWLEGVEDFAE